MKLVLGDSKIELRKIQDGTIDLSVTSPPYDSLREYNNSSTWNEDVWKQIITD